MWGRSVRTFSLQTIPVVQRRGFKFHHITEDTISNANADQIPVGDYLILNRLSNQRMQNMGFSTNLVTLNHFIKHVRQSYEPKNSSDPLKHIPHISKPQALFCLILHSLHFSCIPLKQLTTSQLEMVLEIPKEIIRQLDMTTNQAGLFKKQRSIPSFERNLRQLVSLYRHGDSKLFHSNESVTNYVDSTYHKNLKLSLIAFLVQIKDYEFNEIMMWLSCIAAPDISSACVSLSGLYKIPNFLTKDILLRIPKSEYEVDLLVELIQSHPLQNQAEHFVCLKNILHHQKLFNHTKIPETVSKLLNQRKLSPHHLNQLVSSLSETPQVKNTEDYYLKVLEAQKVVNSHISDSGNQMSVLGCMGLANSLYHVHPSRALMLYESIKSKIHTTEEITLGRILDLKFSNSPESLVQNIDSLIAGQKATVEIWDEFIQRAVDFSMITEKNSPRLLERYKDKPFTSHSTNVFLQNLTTVSLDLFQSSASLDYKSLGIIITKLYQHPDPISSFKSGPDFARYIFHIISNPSRSLVGRVLVGEAYHHPERAYELYQQFVVQYCEGGPNEKCLLSLLIPALKDRKLKWGNTYASQVAVHEFRKNVKTSLTLSDKTLIPSNETWSTYLLLCGKCDYQEEISEVFQIWQNLKVIPSRKALSILLGALPSTMGETIRRHGVQNLKPSHVESETNINYDMSKWDWPTKHEVEYWRSKMVEIY